MSGPSGEQKVVIEDPSRIRIVRSAPGSGKTWLVGEIMKRELEQWNRPGGIAALSFTRVGGDEIRKSVGYELDLPHFVGTLDSFLFRYIVKPFWNKIHPGFAVARLVPAESGVEKWVKIPDDFKVNLVDTSSPSKKSYNIFKVNYNGFSSDGKLQITYQNKGASFLVDSRMSRWIVSEKKKIIQKLGWLTYADVALCSYCILSDKNYGNEICRYLTQRFPFFIVDELQDTGYFQGMAIQQLLKQSLVRALLVGDPDQAIYEFNGATPKLFNTFGDLPNSKELSIKCTRRCPQNIVDIANDIGSSSIFSSNENLGKNYIVTYDSFETGIVAKIERIANEYESDKIRCITRSNSTIFDLQKVSKKDFKSIGCPALTHMSEAVKYFKRGKNAHAFGLAQSCLGLWLFEYEGVDDCYLKEKMIESNKWAKCVIEALLFCVRIDPSLSYESWQSKAGIEIEKLLKMYEYFGLKKFPSSGKLKPKHYSQDKDRKNKGCDDQMSLYLPVPESRKLKIQTVHSVKGETHDATIFICPPPARGRKCPSDIWWSTDPKDAEEKRIAYVAMTRSRKDFYLVVSKATAENLKNKHVEFYNKFEIKE